MISIKLQSSFFEKTLRHGCSVNLLHIFRTPFHEKRSGGLLLEGPQYGPRQRMNIKLFNYNVLPNILDGFFCTGQNYVYILFYVI